MRVEQTEFWTDEMGLKRRAAESIRTSAVEDYFAGEYLEENPAPLRSWEAAGLEEKLEVSAPVEFLERRWAPADRVESAGEEAPAMVEAFEWVDGDPSEPDCLDALRLTPMETVERLRATVVRRSGTMVHAAAETPRFNMTRMLTLTGSLDRSGDGERLMQLPGRAFRAVLTMTERRKISRDFLKDLRAPPRNALAPKFDGRKGQARF
jgi:hypothetical protein